MKKFSVKHANQLGQDKKYDELYAYVKPYIKATCEEMDQNALVFLSLCYDFGYGVEQNCPHAVKLYKFSAEQNNALGMFHYAYALMKGYTIEEDKEKAKVLFEKLAKKGIPEAKYHLATLSEGDTKLKLLKQAAKKNYIPAIIRLAEIYKKEDITKSLEWLKKAVALDSCQAKYELAKHYYEIKEYNEYIRLLEEIVNCDSEATNRAYHEKFCYLNALRKYDFSRDNYPYDYYYKSCKSLGDYYSHPWECQDHQAHYIKAKDFYEAASKKTDNDIEKFYLLKNLGRVYRQGLVTKDNGKYVVDLYFQCLDIADEEKDLDFHCAEPLFFIGLAYLNGIGVEKNSNTAVEYFLKTINDNDANEYILRSCKYYLGLCYYFGDGVQQNVSKAVEFWSANDYAPSKIALAYLYEEGIYFEKDLEKANDIYKKYLSDYDLEYEYEESAFELRILKNMKIRDFLMRIDRISCMNNQNDELKAELEELKQKCYDISSSRENAVWMSDINVRKVRDLSTNISEA